MPKNKKKIEGLKQHKEKMREKKLKRKQRKNVTLPSRITKKKKKSS
jgi:hypothetical protein